jgi:hypothetical protein
MPSYPLTLPETRFTAARVGAAFNNAASLSLSRKVQVVRHPGDLLRLAVRLPPMAREDAAAWVAWGMEMNGRFGTSYAWDPVQKLNGARGAYGGTPLVAGGSQTGFSLDLDGVSNVTGWAKQGDWVQVGGRMKMVTQDADSTGGAVTLALSPGIWAGESPADNDPVVTGSDVKGIFRLTSDEIEWDISTAQHFGLEFSLIEDPS